MFDFTGVRFCFSVAAGVEERLRLRFRCGEGAFDVGDATWRVSLRSVDSLPVEGMEVSHGAAVGELLLYVPPLEAGRYEYEVVASSPSGDVDRVFYGALTVLSSQQVAGVMQQALSAPCREMEVLVPVVAGAPLRLAWRGSSLAAAMVGEVQAAAKEAQAGMDGMLEEAQAAAGRAEVAAEVAGQAVGKLERVEAVLAVLDGSLRDIIEFNPDTGTVWMGDYDTGASYVGEPGKSPYLSDALTWMVFRDGAWVDTQVRAKGKDALPPVISTTGTWLLWDMDAESYSDSGVVAVGRDGVDGQAVRRIVVPSVADIPASGETCTGGYYYYVPLPAVPPAWASGAFFLNDLMNGEEDAGGEEAGVEAGDAGDSGEEVQEPREAWLIINGESLSLGASGDVADMAAAVQAQSKFVVARAADDGSLVLTALAPGEAGNLLSVVWSASEAVEVQTPVGSDNFNFNYMELPAGYVGRGSWASVSMQCRSSASSNMPAGGMYLGIWERNAEDSAWVKVAVSSHAVVQAVGQQVTWNFDKLVLSGRAIRLVLLPAAEADWQTGAFFCMRVSPAEDGELLYYGGSTHSYVPQMVWLSAQVAELGSLSGGVDALPARYAVYAWCVQNASEGWVCVGEANDLATAEVAGLVKLGTDVVVKAGAVVGLDANGQMVVPRATLGDYGAVKAGSYITQVNDRPYQQAVGLTVEGNLANNILYGGALKHMTVETWASKGMEWLNSAMEAEPDKFRAGDYNTGLETSAQFSQSGNMLSLLEASQSRLAGVYLAMGMGDSRAAAVVTPSVLDSHLVSFYYRKAEVNSILEAYATLDYLQQNHYSKDEVYIRSEVDAKELAVRSYVDKLRQDVAGSYVLKTSAANTYQTKVDAADSYHSLKADIGNCVLKRDNWIGNEYLTQAEYNALTKIDPLVEYNILEDEV